MVLPKPMRLRGHKCFEYIYKESSKFYGSYMLMRLAKSKPILLNPHIRKYPPTSIRCAISISNKVSKKAVKRNSLRRLFHNHLNQRLSKLNHICENWLFISLKPNCMQTNPLILLKECDKLLAKAGLVKS